MLLVLGGASLFGSTVLLESNPTFFPAISRANAAMRAASKPSSSKSGSALEVEREEPEPDYEQLQFEERLKAVQAERAEDARLEAAVLEGLSAAKAKVGLEAGSSDGIEFVEAEAVGGEEAGDRAALESIDRSSSSSSSSSSREDGGINPGQQAVLRELSLDDLQRELEQRRAGAGPQDAAV